MNDSTKEWTDWTLEELGDNPAHQKAVFEQMLRRLEVKGECSFVFHQLALALFGDEME